MFSHHFFPKINVPTRFDNSSSNNSSSIILDHIWINKLFNAKSGVVNYDITDHCPTFVHLFCPSFQNNCKNIIPIRFRPYDDNKYAAMRTEIENLNWVEVLGEQISDIDSTVEKFSATLNEIYTKYFPLKTKNISPKRFQNPWITSEIKRYINIKSDFFHLYKEGRISLEINNRMRNKVNKIVANAKNQYYLNAFSRFRSNSRKKWQLINELSVNSRPS